MNWLYIGLVAYLLNAFSFVVSKVMLTEFIPDPWTYTFWVNIAGALTVLLIPFGFFVPSLAVIGASFASGVTYAIALLIFYRLLSRDDTSQVVPLTGGLTPIFVFALALLFLGEFLTTVQVIGFALIVAGGFIVAHEGPWRIGVQHWDRKLLIGSLIAALLFGASQVLIKFVFDQVPFVNGFIWRGFGAVLGAGLLLLPTKPRRSILASFHHPSVRTESVFVFGQIAALLSFVLVNYAISIGPVSLVNALSGVQYAFLFGIIVFLSKRLPKLLKEPLGPNVVRQKAWSIVFITAGVFALFV